jgi:uncharacterized secreted protein with C-terminal beta-propeller domain
MVLNYFAKRLPRTLRGSSPRRARLNIERLEERALLDGTPTQFGSADAFRQYLIDNALTQYQNLFGQTFTSYYYPPIYALDQGVPTAFTATLNSAVQAGGGGADFSQTNVQVQGVDEADFVKTDGNFIYDLRNNELDIVEVGPGNAMKIDSRTAIEGYAQDEFLIGNRVTIISSVYNSPVDPNSIPHTSDGFPLVGVFYGKTKITVLDVTDRTSPTVLTETYVDGYNMGSRAIGNNTIYLVNQNYVTGLPAPAYTYFNGTQIYQTKDQYLQMIAGHELDLGVPHIYSRPGGPGTPLEVVGLVSDPAQIYKPLVSDGNDLLSVFSLDVSAASPTLVQATSILGSYASTIYASPTHLYVAMPHWSTDGSGNVSTDLLQFSLNGPTVTLTAAGSVNGQVLNQFSMDENGQYFRIATTTNWGSNPSNNVFVMTNNAGSLQVVGALSGLAPGEYIRAVSFLGDRAFIVTFQQIDPLFGIDLSNPTAPVSVGELHMPGFSTYLQPLDANHLLGIGRDAVHTGGLALSLFDITDLHNPIEVDHYVVNPPQWNWWWGSGSEAEWNHHAVGYFPEFHTLAIPIYGTYTDFNYSSFVSSLWVFNVDTSTGFTKIGQVDQDSQVRRSLQIGDLLYSIADDSIKVQPIQDPGGPSAELRLVDDPRQPLFAPVSAAAGSSATLPVVTFMVTDPTGLQANIDWGDGQTSAGTIVGGAGGRYMVTGTHSYAQAGSYYTSVKFSRAGTSAGALTGQTQVAGVSDQSFQFIQQVYQDLLHRGAEFSMISYWGSLLDGHTVTRAQVAGAIASSVEYRSNLIQGLYHSLLGRAADAGGLTAFVTWMAQGTTIEEIKRAIMSSQEYFLHAGGTQQSFLAAVYHDVLGRAVDPNGAAAFAGMLGDPLMRSVAAELVLTSPEAERKIVDTYYESLLHRPADDVGIANFTYALAHGARDEDILAAIAGSDEYLFHT